MTEDTEAGEGQDAGGNSEDNRRFEVKWRKKSGASPSSPPPVGVEPVVGESPDVAALQRDLDSERDRVRDLQDKWQRAAADLANLRRRTEQEKGDVEKFASMFLVQQLLPVLDNFDRALATIPGNLQMLTWIQGVMLIERHLRAILEQQGLQPIEAQGQTFSAHFHEAIGERETSDASPETILQEYQKGYTMHGQVIRPTLVEVAKAPVDVARPSMADPGSPPDEQQAPEVDAPERRDKEASEETTAIEGEEIAEQTEKENTGP